MSCGTQHKVQQACKFHFKNPDITDSLASVWYPPTFTTKHDTTIIAGIPSVETNTEYVHDTVKVNGMVFIHDTIRITKTKHIIDTMKLHDVNFIRDTAQISFLLCKVNKDTSLLKSAENSLSMWRKTAFWLIAIILAVTVWKLIEIAISIHSRI